MIKYKCMYIYIYQSHHQNWVIYKRVMWPVLWPNPLTGAVKHWALPAWRAEKAWEILAQPKFLKHICLCVSGRGQLRHRVCDYTLSKTCIVYLIVPWGHAVISLSQLLKCRNWNSRPCEIEQFTKISSWAKCTPAEHVCLHSCINYSRIRKWNIGKTADPHWIRIQVSFCLFRLQENWVWFWIVCS